MRKSKSIKESLEKPIPDQSLYFVGKLSNLKAEVLSGEGYLFANEKDLAQGLNESDIDLDDEVYLVRLVPIRVFINVSVNFEKRKPDYIT